MVIKIKIGTAIRIKVPIVLAVKTRNRGTPTISAYKTILAIKEAIDTLKGFVKSFFIQFIYSPLFF